MLLQNKTKVKIGRHFNKDTVINPAVLCRQTFTKEYVEAKFVSLENLLYVLLFFADKNFVTMYDQYENHD